MQRAVRLLVFAAGVLSVVRADKGSTDYLGAQADAVVVGEIQTGTQTGNSLAFTLSVVRRLKGDAAPGQTLNVTGRSRLAFNRGLGGQYGLWFLKKAGTQWTVIPVFPGSASLEASCFFPLSKQRSPTDVRTALPATSLSDAVVVELFAALEGYSTPLQLFNLTAGLLSARESRLTTEQFSSLRASRDPQLRFAALAGLLGGPDDSHLLAEIADNLDVVARLHTRSLLLAAVSSTRAADRMAVQSLGKMALWPSSNPELARAAALALKTVHTEDSLPFLARLMDSGDAATRECAMQGLSRFVDNLPIPTPQGITSGKALRPQGPQPHRTPETDKYSLSTQRLEPAREGEYLQFWKSWWTAMKDKLPAAGR